MLVLVALSPLTQSPSLGETQCPACGDVNCDELIDAIDAMLIAQNALGLRPNLLCGLAGDVSADGSVDIVDALQVGQYAVGLRSVLICAPVVTGITPTVVSATGGERVQITGSNFVAGGTVQLGGLTVAATYLDCRTLEITAPRGRPGITALAVINPGGHESNGTFPLSIEGGFRDVTARARLDFVPQRGDDLLPTAGGVVIGDVDGDGELDIFLPNHAGPNALFRNRRDGTFDNVAVAAGVDDPAGKGTGACLGDYDNDGDLDLYVTNLGPNRFFRNNGDRTFTDVANLAGVADSNRGTGCSWGDFDRDGFLDLYVANYLDESDRSVFVTRQFAPARRSGRLFHNLRNGLFEDVTHLLGDTSLVTGAGFGASFVDYDNDGDPDLYLINDFGREIQPNVLWRNDGPGGDGWRFVDVSALSGANIAIYGMGLAIGDYDADGLFDFYVTNIGRNVLLHARIDGQFEDRTSDAGVGRPLVNEKLSIGWGTAFLDYDNDGAQDLYLVAGYLDSDPLANDVRQPNALFRNRRDGTFEDVSDTSGADDPGIGRGLAMGDFNHDGFLDILVVNLGQGVVLLENTARASGNWLEVDLIGTRSNRDGIGTRVTVTVGSRRLMREVTAGGSSMSQHSLEMHFGLGPVQSVDSVQINWPSGVQQEIRNVAANQRLTVEEP